MRKVGAFNNEVHAIQFVEHLQSKHITALIEEDNGAYAIWVHDEGHIEQAKNLFEKSQAEGPSFFKHHKPRKNPTSPKPPRFQEKDKGSKQIAYQPYVTKILLILCVVVFVFVKIQWSKDKEGYPGMSALPPIAKALVIDYPKGDEILGELIDRYGLEKIRENKLPKEAHVLIAQHNQEIPWVGIYNIILQPKENRDLLWKGKFLANISDGQVWRIFTPAILHIGLLHLLFNILWLSVLGKMIEFNMGRVRFILLILISAIISNICQYLMTGPFFMGVSGVLSAFIGYIWVRKKRAPWEVYLVAKQNIDFFLIFILGFLGISIIAFFLKYFQIYSLNLTIANTAHISGLLTGMFLARIGILSRKISS